MKKINIALAGNPNCGKTTIYNNITGSNQRVGNYSGVTVEKREGNRTFENYNINIVDLPGTYSLTAKAEDELVARRHILESDLDYVINVVDASNLERNLYLTIQLAELEKPFIIALNMIDAAYDMHLSINDQELSESFSAANIVRTVASKNIGTLDLLQMVSTPATKPVSFKVNYGEHVEQVIKSLCNDLQCLACHNSLPLRWLVIKLLENDAEVEKMFVAHEAYQNIRPKLERLQHNLIEEFDEDLDVYFAQQRYAHAQKLANKIVTVNNPAEQTFSDKIDKVLTDKVFGLPIFFALMWLMFNLVFTLGQYPQGWIEEVIGLFSSFIQTNLPEGQLNDLIVEGIIGGVGGVIVFLPNILLLFFCIALLEGTGYMARAAFLMDRIMRAAGMHGKSFIPLLLGFGCTVPAIMATRTLENPRDRLVTILVSPFMSCSARLPVYTLLIGAFFSENFAGTVLFGIYIFGILLAVMMAKLFRGRLLPGEVEPFVMEMPPYRLPTFKTILLQMWERATLYLKKAGTIILASSIIIWFLINNPAVELSKNYEQDITTIESSILVETDDDKKEILNLQIENLRAQMQAEKVEGSYAGRVGKAVEPLIKPVGFDWKIGISIIAAFSAKEIMVSTLGTIYSVSGGGEGMEAIRSALQADPNINPLVALSLMVFVLIYTPCVATLAVIYRETNSWGWPIFSATYSLVLAWIMSFIVFQGGKVLGF